MKRLSTGIFAVLCVASLACGGGGGGGGGGPDAKICADMATAINTCMTEGGGETNPHIQAMCEAATCTGSKQTVIDTVLASDCDVMQEDSLQAMVSQGCEFPATCTGVAYQLMMCAEKDYDDVLATCNNDITCDTAAHKTAAMQCIVSLNCLTADDTDLENCLIDNNCTVPN